MKRFLIYALTAIVAVSEVSCSDGRSQRVFEALSQLNRNLMSRQAGNGRPVLSDLRDSGAIEQDADMVLLLHRPGMLGLEEDLKRTELIVAKNRNGRIGDIELVYEGDIVKFYDLKSPDMDQEWPDTVKTGN